MSLRTRLSRLEQARGGRDPGCPACRDRRGHLVMVASIRLPDGTTAPEGEWPAPCGRCGEAPEQIIEFVEEVVETHEDMARLDAEGRTGPA